MMKTTTTKKIPNGPTPMTQFEEKMRQTVHTACLKKGETLDAAREALRSLKEKIQAEKSGIDRLHREKQALTDNAEAVVESDRGAYDKYKKSILNKNADIAAAEEALALLEKTLLPQRTNEFNKARLAVMNELTKQATLFSRKCSECLDEMMIETIAVHDSFLACADKLSLEYLSTMMDFSYLDNPVPVIHHPRLPNGWLKLNPRDSTQRQKDAGLIKDHDTT
jgi:hypothetical protein